MEKKHKQRITEKFKDEVAAKEIIVLNIPDDYQYMDEELIDELNSKLSAYIHLS